MKKITQMIKISSWSNVECLANWYIINSWISKVLNFLILVRIYHFLLIAGTKTLILNAWIWSKGIFVCILVRNHRSIVKSSSNCQIGQIAKGLMAYSAKLFCLKVKHFHLINNFGFFCALDVADWEIHHNQEGSSENCPWFKYFKKTLIIKAYKGDYKSDKVQFYFAKNLNLWNSVFSCFGPI
jgi:hypothetical protein